MNMNMYVDGIGIWSYAGDAGMHGICRFVERAVVDLCSTDGLTPPTWTL